MDPNSPNSPNDLILTLVDQHNEITIDLHKKVLSTACIYFEKLFTTCREKFMEEITIYVPNAFVCYDCIMSFYGETTNIGGLIKYLHMLEYIKCSDFLGLPIMFDGLKNEIIPTEYFEKLLSIIPILGYDSEVIDFVIKNMPEKYDLTMLDKTLVKKILDHCRPKIIAGDWNNNLTIFNGDTGTVIGQVTVEKLSDGNRDAILSVHISPDNKQIVTGHYSGCVRIWRTEDLKLIEIINGHKSFVASVFFSYDNKKIVSCGKDRTVKIWDIANGKNILLHTLSVNIGWILSVCFSRDDKKIVAGCADKTIRIWDSDTGELINTLADHGDVVNTVACSPDNKKIISGSRCIIKIWDIETGDLLNSINAHNDLVTAICFTLDHNIFVSTGNDNTIKIWDNDMLVRTITGHQDVVCGMNILSDNKTIVSASWDHTIKIWNINDSCLLKTIQHDDVSSVCYTNFHHTDLVNRLVTFQ